MDARFDVVVVGARCAGSSLAAQLAHAGLRVCAVDRADFPSDTPSTHVFQAEGLRVLDRIGALGRVLATGAPPLVRARSRSTGSPPRARCHAAQVTALSPCVSADRRLTPPSWRRRGRRVRRSGHRPEW